ncbi:MAG: ROK family protein [Saprospiraceae bacterium]|nr:ROK family protein [Saprospiraceae bacterium]
MALLWGIDLGGTKIEGVVLEGRSPDQVVLRRRIDTESRHGYQHILQRIVLLIREMEHELGVTAAGLGMGTPGAIDPPTGLLKNSNTVCLNQQPFHRDIEDLLKIPVRIANDANCFALAEAQMGVVASEMPEAAVVFGVIMGTGVGGGVVVNGQVLGGRHGIGGEWGHNFLDDSGGACYCGKTGCVERVISGTALQRFYADAAGEERKLREIYQRHQAGVDQHATATIDRLIHFFGKGISTVINILDPDAIVLGGGVGNIDLLYTEGVKAVEPYIFNPRVNTRFLRPALGDSAGVFGAALLNP